MNNDSQSVLREIQLDFKELSKDMRDVNISLAKVEKEISFHIKRTEQLESQYFTLADQYMQLAQQFSRWRGAVALSGWVFGAVIAVIQIAIRVML